MNTYKQASEIIERNQSAIVIFTRGEHFSFDADGNGSTGKWVVAPEHVDEVDKVIIYLRRDDETVNRIYLGNYAGVRPSEPLGAIEEMARVLKPECFRR
jgi:hypothetical protein